jgi:hypothetical protein
VLPGQRDCKKLLEQGCPVARSAAYWGLECAKGRYVEVPAIRLFGFKRRNNLAATAILIS